MPMSSNINTYADIAAVLQQVVPVGKARYTLPTPGQAKRWAQRAYKYRLLLQKQLADQNKVKGYTPSTPLDRMVLRCEGATVAIDLNPAITGRLSLPGGEVISPEVPALAKQVPAPASSPTPGPLFPDEPDDDLAELARRIAAGETFDES